MRNGNRWNCYAFVNKFNVLILPMRNGNSVKSSLFMSGTKVLILPMRNGNWVFHGIRWNSKEVLILPMRNGNFFVLYVVVLAFWFLSYLWGMETIFICPQVGASACLFLSYLWGMETMALYDFVTSSISRSYPTYEEWKPKLNDIVNDFALFVLILPMRNGNSFVRIRYKSLSLVLILPMRNGNFPATL